MWASCVTPTLFVLTGVICNNRNCICSHITGIPFQYHMTCLSKSMTAEQIDFFFSHQQEALYQLNLNTQTY